MLKHNMLTLQAAKNTHACMLHIRTCSSELICEEESKVKLLGLMDAAFAQ